MLGSSIRSVIIDKKYMYYIDWEWGVKRLYDQTIIMFTNKIMKIGSESDTSIPH